MALYDNAVPNPAGFRDVSVEQVAGLPTNSATRIIDVRETEEWLGELGHAETALHIPLATVAQHAAAWPKDTETVLICRSGNRSGRAALLLHGLGFSRVMNMVGGMLAWDAAKRPVARGR